MKESDILHENGNHWVSREKGVGHFKVWEVRGCASYLCGTFHFSSRPEYALERAIKHCNNREPSATVTV